MKTLIIATAIFLFGGAGIHQVSLWNARQALAKTEVADVQAMSVKSDAQSSDEPQNQFVVHEFAVIVCLNGADVSVDKTDPVFVVICEE